MSEWHQSSYFSILSFCSQDTLDELRNLWHVWSKSAALSPKKQAEVAKNLRQHTTKNLPKLGEGRGQLVWALHSTGPLILDGKSFVGNAPKQYWRTGLVGPHAYQADCKLVNPTFYYMNEGSLNLYYATSPLSAFHLARSLAPLQLSTAPGSHNKTRLKPDMRSVEADVYDQFTEWCTATRAMFHHPKKDIRPRIRFFVGEVLALCLTLQAYSRDSRIITSGQYVKPWSNTSLILDGDDYSTSAVHPAPATFNVIETSNLSDHLGILNVLAATIPLLSRSTLSSVLYTESLQRGTMKDSLRTSLCVDFVIFQVLFGVSPSTAGGFYFSSHSSGHELLLGGLTTQAHNSTMYHERVAWKNITTSSGATESSSDQLDLSMPSQYKLTPGEIGALLASMYYYMFRKENWEARIGHFGSPSFPLGLYGWLEYVRGSFVALLLIVRRRLFSSTSTLCETTTAANAPVMSVQDWDTMTDALLAAFCLSDQSPIPLPTINKIALMHFDELCCQLHLHGLIDLEKAGDRLGMNWGVMIKGDDPNQDRDTQPTGTKLTGRFSKWKVPLPNVIRAVLVVPRHKLKKGGEETWSKLVTTFMCYVKSPDGSRSAFSSLHIVSGRVVSAPKDEGNGTEKIVVEEDKAGVEGTSALVVSFWMPMHLLVPSTSTKKSSSVRGNGRNGVEIGLAIHPSPQVMEECSRKLGPELRLFSVDLEDKEHLYFSRELPAWASPSLFVPSAAPENQSADIPPVSNKSDSSLPLEQKASSSSSSASASASSSPSSYIQITFFPTIATYTAHFSLANHPNQDLKTTLLGGAAVSYDQLTACRIVVRFGGHELSCVFPSPVNGEAVKVRIARKSSYIEVYLYSDYSKRAETNISF
jgi:hypothetical protein